MSTSPPTDTDADQAQPNTVQVQATEQQLKARAEGASIEDYLLPRSITLRLAKSVLPPNTSVQKDAVLAIQKAATVFVSYLSSHANEATLKRTVSPADVLNALSELEFEGFRPRLEKELDKFTDLKAAKRKPRKSGDGDTKANADAGAESKNGVQAATDGSGDAEMKEVVVRGAKAKRVKRDGDDGEIEMEDQDHDQDPDDEGEDGGDADEMEEEHEEDADDTEEEDEEGEEERGEDEDLDRVEDLDRGAQARRLVDPDAAGDSDSDEEGPGSQLRGDLGLG
ncbi:histone-fold-containing protein [Aspergillus terricola var. indicus]